MPFKTTNRYRVTLYLRAPDHEDGTLSISHELTDEQEVNNLTHLLSDPNGVITFRYGFTNRHIPVRSVAYMEDTGVTCDRGAYVELWQATGDTGALYLRDPEDTTAWRVRHPDVDPFPSVACALVAGDLDLADITDNPRPVDGLTHVATWYAGAHGLQLTGTDHRGVWPGNAAARAYLGAERVGELLDNQPVPAGVPA